MSTVDPDGIPHQLPDPPRFDHPLSWSVPLVRIGETTFRIHASLLALIVVVLVRAAWHTGDESFPLGPWLAGVLLACLVCVVTIHELATLVASRLLGGDMPEVVLQPLGGLDEGVLPRSWQRGVIVAMAGPAVTMMISMITLVVLSLASRDAGVTQLWSRSGIYSPALVSSPWMEAAFVLGQVSLVVAAVNLLPSPPFRGRLLFESLLRPRVGARSAMSITRLMGIVVAVIVFVVGVILLSLPVVLVSAMCAASIQRRGHRHRLVESVDRLGALEPAVSGGEPSLRPTAEVSSASDLFEILADPEEPTGQEASGDGDALDRILGKISESGLESLDEEERQILDKATRRRRDQP
jgi:Zn-dependent protease